AGRCELRQSGRIAAAPRLRLPRAECGRHAVGRGGCRAHLAGDSVTGAARQRARPHALAGIRRPGDGWGHGWRRGVALSDARREAAAISAKCALGEALAILYSSTRIAAV